MEFHCLDKPLEISYFLIKAIFEKANQAFLPQHSIPFPCCFELSTLSLLMGAKRLRRGQRSSGCIPSILPARKSGGAINIIADDYAYAVAA
jgi:hypothetical protein